MTPDQIRELAGQTAQGISADALSGKPFNPMMASLKLQTGTMYLQAETAAHLAEQTIQLTRIADVLEKIATPTSIFFDDSGTMCIRSCEKAEAARVEADMGKGKWEPS